MLTDYKRQKGGQYLLQFEVRTKYQLGDWGLRTEKEKAKSEAIIWKWVSGWETGQVGGHMAVVSELLT